MKIGSADVPAGAALVRAEEKCSLRSSHQEEKVSTSDLNMPNAVQSRRSGCRAFGGWNSRCDRGSLNRVQSCLHFTGALVALRWLFVQTTLDDGPKPGRHW